jgi:hypothetical protein
MSAPRHEQGPGAKASKALDEALEESFPASDPIAASPKRAGKDDKRVNIAVEPQVAESETTDAKTPANMAKFHKVFERRRR